MHIRALGYFGGSAVFHYIGPAFAVLLFDRIPPLGVAALRIWSAAVVFAIIRRPWRGFARLSVEARLATLLLGGGVGGG